MSEHCTIDPPLSERARGAGAALLAGGSALGELPLSAQVLIASRLLQRAALAMQSALPTALRDLIDLAIAAMQDCAGTRGQVHRHRTLFEHAMAQRDVEATDQSGPIRGMLWYAIDATRAADAAQDFPVDATVMHSTLKSLSALTADARVVPLQLHVLMAADIDLLAHACTEARVDRYAALPDAVFQRLAPVHALTLIDAVREEPSWR